MKHCLILAAISFFPFLANGQALPGPGDIPSWESSEALMEEEDSGAAKAVSPAQAYYGPRYRRVLASDGESRWLAEEGAAPLDYGDGIDESYQGDLDGDGLDDFILNLGACGNWGYCVQAILMGRPDAWFSLAMEPDYYYEFVVEPSVDGTSVTLWELTRGASAMRDDLGRFRWEPRDGRLYRTEYFELIQLMRPFEDPVPRSIQRLRVKELPGDFFLEHRFLGEGAGIRVYRVSEDGRLGVIRRVGGEWERIEETVPPDPPVEPTWITVNGTDGPQGKTCTIEVLAADGNARLITLTLEPELRWETQGEGE